MTMCSKKRHYNVTFRHFRVKIMAFQAPKQLETPLNKGSSRITSAVETVSSRYGNCQFPLWKLSVPGQILTVPGQILTVPAVETRGN